MSRRTSELSALSLMTAGSPEEVEIRPCALHAVERIAACYAGRRARQLGTREKRVTGAPQDWTDGLNVVQ
jgi:hypothetical protein